MHAIKGSWVGQTFALAKNNESEGRKSRIRRSKEERKEMVESFIKRYQKLHNGSFPSLNLTHKEVGGSFYTVREIVRDVIQENRVLGPAKFTEEETIDQFLDNNPLGSIAAEPNNALSTSPNESQFDTNQNLGRLGQLVFASDGHLATVEHQVLENGQIINGTQVLVSKKEFDEPKSTELQVKGPVETGKKVAQESVVPNGHSIGPECQVFDNGLVNGIHIDLECKEIEELTCTELQSFGHLEAEKNGEVLATSGSKVTPIATDVMVETFPLKPASGKPESLNGSLGENLTLPTEDEATRGIELPARVDSPPGDRVNSKESLAGDKVALNLSNLSVEKKSSSVDEEALGCAKDASLDSSNCPTFKEGNVQGKGITDLSVKAPNNDVPVSETFDQSQLTAGTKAIEAPDGLHRKNINGTSGGSGLSKTEEVLVIGDEINVQSSGSLQKGSNPTLDRIYIESWEGASKKSEKATGNPVWDAFKAFVDAFVKFWSE